MFLRCKGREGSCAQPIAELNSAGELVVIGRHHSERHETHVLLTDLLRESVDGLPVKIRTELRSILEVSA